MAASSVILSLILVVAIAGPQAPTAPSAPPPVTKTEAPPAAVTPPFDGPETPIVTHHELRANGKTLRYTATTGFLPIRSAQGEIEARIFFIAYTLDGVPDPSRRSR